jgi:hypothetical protein
MASGTSNAATGDSVKTEDVPSSALAMTILLCLLAAISATTFIIPAKLDPATLKVSNLNVYALILFHY